MSSPLLEMRQIRKSYPARRAGRVQVLRDVSWAIAPAEALGLMGVSGAGKSTIARIALGLERPDAGEVFFNGSPIAGWSGKRQRHHFQRVQMVWQDPAVFLNPYQSVLPSIIEPMAAFGIGTPRQHRARARELMERLGLPMALGRRKPARLSGGQCQRVAIARALAVAPRLLICDEALANLDLPQQVDILKLLKQLQKELQLCILFISHDRDAVRALCDRTLVVSSGTCIPAA